MLHSVEQFGQLGADEGGNDGRRCLVGPQTVVVSGTGNGRAQHIGVLVDGGDRVDEEGQEAQVGLGIDAGLQEVDAGVRAQGPVVVLAGTIQAGKRLLVEEHPEVVALCHALQQVHEEQVVVVGQVGLLKYGRHLELVRRHLVVAGGDRDAQFVGLALELLHESHHAGRNAAEVVVIELLALGRGGAEQGAAGLAQVGAGVVQSLVDQEVLLLPSEGGHHLRDVLVEVLADVRRGLVHSSKGLQERRLIVEGLAGVGDEDGRDAQRLAHQEWRAARVPQRVTAGFEGRADATVRKA